MPLTREQIESIAHLARLELSAAEVPVYQESLSAILDFVGELDRADTGERRADGAPAARVVAASATRMQ
jgi:aspartyl/glutamyl-tRNA(Asn/Gln) amidotransferase C subunit